MDIRKHVLKVFEEGHLMSLGTLDDTGVWVADVVYTFDQDLNIYWMSDPEARHSEAVKKNRQVSGTITVSNKSGEKNLGIQFAGIAEKIDGNDFEITKLYFAKKRKSIPNETDDVLQGDSWYKVTPSKIELIDELNFGYERQTYK